MWNIKYVWIHRNGTFFLTCIISDKRHFFDKISRIENIIDAKKKDANFLQYLYFFLLPFLFFFNIVVHFYVSFIYVLYEIRIHCISFSTLLKQYRLFIFHLSRYKNLIHIISFLFPYPAFSHFIMLWKETRNSLTPLNVNFKINSVFSRNQVFFIYFNLINFVSLIIFFPFTSILIHFLSR